VSRGPKRIRNIVVVGCGGAVAVVLFVLTGLLTVAWVQVGGETLQSSELVADLPSSDHTRDVGEAPSATRVTPSDDGTDPPALHLYLDIKDANVVVLPGPVGSTPRVEASYDTRYFSLEHKEAAPVDGVPVWHVRFRRVSGSGSMMHRFHLWVGATPAEVRVELPPDVTLSLQGNLERGDADIRFEGLRITDCLVEIAGGNLTIDSSNAALPMTRFEVSGRQANLELIRVGDASPAEVEIDSVLGWSRIDLRGAWRYDATVSLETEASRGTVKLPEDVQFVGLDQVNSRPSTAEVPLPTLQFEVEGRAGGKFTFEH
jgi:hypothetical protein